MRLQSGQAIGSYPNDTLCIPQGILVIDFPKPGKFTWMLMYWKPIGGLWYCFYQQLTAEHQINNYFQQTSATVYSFQTKHFLMADKDTESLSNMLNRKWFEHKKILLHAREVPVGDADEPQTTM